MYLDSFHFPITVFFHNPPKNLHSTIQMNKFSYKKIYYAYLWQKCLAGNFVWCGWAE